MGRLPLKMVGRHQETPLWMVGTPLWMVQLYQGTLPSMGLLPGKSPVGTWSKVKSLLDEWDSTLNWGRAGTQEAIELTLREIGDCLVGLSSCSVG